MAAPSWSCREKIAHFRWLLACVLNVSQGRICSDNFTCCHTEIEVAYQTFCLTQWQYTDHGPTSPNVDLIMPATLQGNHCANLKVTGMTRPGEIPTSQAGFKPRICRSPGYYYYYYYYYYSSHSKALFAIFLQSPHSAANCLQHVRSSGPDAIVCKSRATHRAFITCKCHVTCHLVRRDSSAIKFDRVELAFI